MLTIRRVFVVLCLLFLLSLAIAVRATQAPTITSLLETVNDNFDITSDIDWNESSLKETIKYIANEEQFGNVQLLERLAYHESRFLLYPKIMDTNGYYSYGLFHFQLNTFLEQAKKYDVIPQETTLDEGRHLIMNPILQLRTICRMGNDNILNIKKHWQLSWDKIHRE